ncbi:MAG: hypothetical protein RLZ98_1394 [Pseudomonadota bacterium]|jgi:4'-phosphopantetheinyl transferase
MPELSEKRIDVWFWSLDAAAELSASLSELSHDERIRADRLQQPLDRQRFLAARNGLRRILSRYLDCAPEELAFRLGAHGKPAIASIDTPIHFNLSHSFGAAALAVTGAGDVGIDIEYVRLVETDIDSLFTDAERSCIAAAPPSDHQHAFLRCWTRKEAVIKALGSGFQYDLQSIEVTVAATEAPRIVRLDHAPGDLPNWSLHHLDHDPGIIGALAVRTPSTAIATFLEGPPLPPLDRSL